MAKIKNLKLRASAGAMALALSGMILGPLSLAPVFAQTTDALSIGQATAIQAGLDRAIAAVYGQGLAGDALTAALQTTIAQAETDAVAAYGADAAASITSAILAAPGLAGLPGSLIGTALGQAAAVIAATQGLAAARAVAATVANEGPLGSQTAFALAEIAAGGPQSVADVATGAPTATGFTGFTGGSFIQAGSPGLAGGTAGSGSGCATPSCS